MAPVDFDLAAFHSIVRVLKRTFRLLMEACISNLILKDVSLLKLLPPDELSPKDPSIPLFSLPRNCTGIIFKRFLEFETEPNTQNNSDDHNNSDPHQKWRRLETELKATFPCCPCPMTALFKALRFWLEVRRVIEWLAQNIDVGVFKEDMEEAHRYLLRRLHDVGLHHHPLFQGEPLPALRAEVLAA